MWDESYMNAVTVTPSGKIYASGIAYQNIEEGIDSTGEIWQLASGTFTPRNPNGPVNSAFWGVGSNAGAAFAVGDESDVPHPTAAAMKLIG